MNDVPKIFKESINKNYISRFSKDDVPDFETKYNKILLWRKTCIEGDLERTKEKQLQGAFLIQVFDEILGYSAITSVAESVYNQKQEFNNVLDASEADGSLGYFSNQTKLNNVQAVIELKDAKKDLDKKQNRASHQTPVEQGFTYANKNGSGCKWVIISNFVETRLYRSTSSLEYETFDLRKMDDIREFLRFYYLLCKDNLISEIGPSKVDLLYKENEDIGIKISEEFYKTYKTIRNELHDNLIKNNPNYDKYRLFTKAQKLMDRFVFMCFCEDCDLLPPNTFQKIVDTASHSFSSSHTKVWDELKGLFHAIDKGNPDMGINHYNGGLFSEDTELDSLIIEDSVLKRFTLLSNYDFGSDLNVNILGQIFEQSISDVEDLKCKVNGYKADNRSKRKKDGIYYTPYYVTRYIVENTIGTYLHEQQEKIKKELFEHGPFIAKIKNKVTKRENTIQIDHWEDYPVLLPDASIEEKLHRDAVGELHLAFWTAYEEAIKAIKICDPACGSGAFLNQCFDYLSEEMNNVLDNRKYYGGGQISLFDISKQILQNNLYGVDLNPESVEITKLSLWLKTAKNNQTLASLDGNIKCGNSLVNDSSVVDNSFNWDSEFPDVFNKGGFDIIIGNPPYGALVDSKQKEFITSNYEVTEGNFDTFKVFFELGIKLLKDNGYLGYITPNTFFATKKSGTKLRSLLFSFELKNIVELTNVFKDAVVDTVITVFKKNHNDNNTIKIINIPRKTVLSSTFINEGIVSTRAQSDLFKHSDLTFNYLITHKEEELLDKITDNTQPLVTYCDVYNGAKPYQNGKGIPPMTEEMMEQKVYQGYEKIDDTWVPYMRGKVIDKFTDLWDGLYIKYGVNLAEPRNPAIFNREKIFIRQTGDTLITMLDNGHVSNNTLHVIYSRDEAVVSNYYVLGLLNSDLLTWIYQRMYSLEIGKDFAEVKKIFVEELPLAIGTSQQQDAVITVAKQLSDLCQKRQNERVEFIHFLEQKYGKQGELSNLCPIADCDFKTFLSDLKNKKIKLDVFEQREILPLFENERANAVALTKKINEKYAVLNTLVYEIYDIQESDIKSSALT